MKVLRDNLSVFLGLDSEGASSMKLVLVTVLASLFVSAFPQATTGNDDTGWSSPVNGLQARLSVARGQALNGTPLITTYLELRNAADVSNELGILGLPQRTRNASRS